MKIPSISSTSDTVFYLQVDATSDKEDANNVWDSNYVMVHHMDSALVDSTGNGNNGTNVGSILVDGENGKARYFDGSDRIELTNVGLSSIGGNNNSTIEVVMKPDDTTPSGSQMFVMHQNSIGRYPVAFFLKAQEKLL